MQFKGQIRWKISWCLQLLWSCILWCAHTCVCTYTHTPSHEYRYVLKQVGAEAEPMGMAMLFNIFTLSATNIILAHLSIGCKHFYKFNDLEKMVEILLKPEGEKEPNYKLKWWTQACLFFVLHLNIYVVFSFCAWHLGKCYLTAGKSELALKGVKELPCWASEFLWLWTQSSQCLKGCELAIGVDLHGNTDRADEMLTLKSIVFLTFAAWAR